MSDLIKFAKRLDKKLAQQGIPLANEDDVKPVSNFNPNTIIQIKKCLNEIQLVNQSITKDSPKEVVMSSLQKVAKSYTELVRLWHLMSDTKPASPVTPLSEIDRLAPPPKRTLPPGMVETLDDKPSIQPRPGMQKTVKRLRPDWMDDTI